MHSIETAHFLISDGRIRPRVPRGIGNELADHIAAELVPLGLVPDGQAFERIFVDAVLSTQPDPARAWTAFYDSTMRRLRRADRAGTGSVATFARIYDRALSLVRGTAVLDVGCCFGFLPLLAAERDPRLRVIGTDLVPATAALAGRISRARGGQARFAAADLQALDTHVVSPDGFDHNCQLSSSYDLTLFARHGLKNADFRGYCHTRTANFPAGEIRGQVTIHDER